MLTFYDEESLLKHAKSLKGKKIHDLLAGKDFDSGKGAIGNIIEREGFGIANNNDARPDFAHLGIELKALPLKVDAKGGLRVKERTKVCSINYKELIKERWDASHAKSKLIKILFVFYRYDSKSPNHSQILDFHLFHLGNADEPLISSDWHRTQQRVQDGKAHELSESENVVLAASRSGAGKLSEDKWPEQPNQIYQARARQRAFSLKPSFTRAIWQEVSQSVSYDRILDKFSYQSIEQLEHIILEKLNVWEGVTLKEFMEEQNLPMHSAKNAHASILRAALGFKTKNKAIKEIDQLGLMVKTTPCRTTDFYPFESMSFPYQPLGDIKAEERFDESEFYTYLQGFLIIPLLRAKREDKSPEKVRFGKSFIWRPSKTELLGIQQEWENIHATINKGILINRKPTKNKKGFILQNNLLKETKSTYIHVRPHARDSYDIDKSLGEISISKQCFWFNKKWIQVLISKAKK